MQRVSRPDSWKCAVGGRVSGPAILSRVAWERVRLKAKCGMGTKAPASAPLGASLARRIRRRDHRPKSSSKRFYVVRGCLRCLCSSTCHGLATGGAVCPRWHPHPKEERWGPQLLPVILHLPPYTDTYTVAPKLGPSCLKRACAANLCDKNKESLLRPFPTAESARSVHSHGAQEASQLG